MPFWRENSCGYGSSFIDSSGKPWQLGLPFAFVTLRAGYGSLCCILSATSTAGTTENHTRWKVVAICRRIADSESQHKATRNFSLMVSFVHCAGETGKLPPRELESWIASVTV